MYDTSFGKIYFNSDIKMFKIFLQAFLKQNSAVTAVYNTKQLTLQSLLVKSLTIITAALLHNFS